MKKARIVAMVGWVLAVGCSQALVGTWKNEKETPKESKYFIKQLDFRDSGTYAASAKQADKDLYLQGSYDFNGATLTLKPKGQAEKQYKAIVW